MPEDVEEIRFIIEGNGAAARNGGGGGGTAPKPSKGSEETKFFGKMGKATAGGLKKAGVSASVASLLKQSQIFTGTLGSIFQIAGALIDVFLAPIIVPLLVPLMKLMTSLMPVFKILGEFIGKIVQKVVDFLTAGGWKVIVAGLLIALAGFPVIGWLIILATTFKYWYPVVQKIAEGIWAYMKFVFKAWQFIFTQLWNVIKKIAGWYVKLIAKWWELIKWVYGKIWSFIKSFFSEIIAFAKDPVGYLKALPDRITKWAKEKWEMAKEFINAFPGNVTSFIGEKVDGIKEWFGGIKDRILGFLPSGGLTAAILGWIDDLIARLRRILPSFLGGEGGGGGGMFGGLFGGGGGNKGGDSPTIHVTTNIDGQSIDNRIIDTANSRDSEISERIQLP